MPHGGFVTLAPMPFEPHPCLSVVIPCYNEESTVASVIETVLGIPWVGQVVVVDDGSTDKSREILAAIDDPRVDVVLQPVNRGKGAALRTGFAKATQEFVVVQDADLEYDPSEFELLLGPLLENKADVVFGSRFLGGGAHRVLRTLHKHKMIVHSGDFCKFVYILSYIYIYIYIYSRAGTCSHISARNSIAISCALTFFIYIYITLPARV